MQVIVKSSISKSEYVMVLLLSMLWGVSFLLVAFGSSPLQSEDKKSLPVFDDHSVLLTSSSGSKAAIYGTGMGLLHDK